MSTTDLKKSFLFSSTFWKERGIPIILGIGFIISGIILYYKNIARIEKITISDYIAIEGFLSEKITIANGGKSNYRYIDFKLSSDDYENVNFRDVLSVQ